MTIMRTIEIAKHRKADFRAAIPGGVEHYVINSGDRIFVNVRTADDLLFDSLRDNLEAVLPAAE